MTKDKAEKVEGFFKVEHGLIKDDNAIALVGVNAWAVYCVLTSYINAEKGVSFPSYDMITQKTGLGRGTVSKALKTLEEHGLIEKKTKGKAHGDNNTYVIHSRPTKKAQTKKRNMSRSKTEKGERQDTPPAQQAITVTEPEPVKVNVDKSIDLNDLTLEVYNLGRGLGKQDGKWLCTSNLSIWLEFKHKTKEEKVSELLKIKDELLKEAKELCV